MKLLKNLDLTKGNILKSIVLFTIPILIGNVFQQLYNFVDAVIVGQTMGSNAYVAVGVTGSLTFLVLGFANGLASGLAVPTSQYFGAKDYEKVRRGVATSIIIALVVGLILTLASLLCSDLLLKMINTSPSLFYNAEQYINAIFAGIIATIFYNLISHMLRALGDSKTPLIALIIAAILNVGLDFLFIAVFKWGTAGAGWATVLSQFLAGIACFIYMFYKYPYTRVKWTDFKLTKDMTLYHIKLSIPMAFQFSIVAIGLIVQQSAVNSLDAIYNGVDGHIQDLYATAYVNASKINNFPSSILMALGTAMATYCGQNYGAKNAQRIKNGLIQATFVNIGLSIILASLSIPLSPYIVPLLSSDVPSESIPLTQYYLLIQGCFYCFLGGIYVYRSSLQGLGKSYITIAVGTIELVARIVVSILFTKYFEWQGLCFSDVTAWFFANIILIPAAIIVYKKIKIKFAEYKSCDDDNFKKLQNDDCVTSNIIKSK